VKLKNVSLMSFLPPFVVLLVLISMPSFAEAASRHKKIREKAAEESTTVTAAAANALVTDVRYWSNPDYTRIAITLDRDVPYEYHQLQKDASGKLPPRLYLDLKGARLVKGIKDVPIGDGLLRMARVGQYRPDTVRIVLDIDTIKDFKIFPLSDPARIIIDVKGERKTEISQLQETIQAAASLEEGIKEPGSEEKKSPSPLYKPGKIRRIVVDPGHGGHDPGAMGADGSREKDVVLDIGLKLAKKLKEEMGIDVVMTRSTDVFIPLEARR
jgi:N-acetylmuramoyl-L-alanine amidase